MRKWSRALRWPTQLVAPSAHRGTGLQKEGASSAWSADVWRSRSNQVKDYRSRYRTEEWRRVGAGRNSRETSCGEGNRSVQPRGSRAGHSRLDLLHDGDDFGDYVVGRRGARSDSGDVLALEPLGANLARPLDVVRVHSFVEAEFCEVARVR